MAPSKTLDASCLDALFDIYDAITSRRTRLDAEITRAIKKHTALDRKGRAFVARAAYGLARQRLYLEAVAAASPDTELTPRLAVSLYVVADTHLTAAEFPPGAYGRDARKATSLLEAFLKRPMPADPAQAMALRRAMPAWFTAALIDELGFDEADALTAALREEAPVTIRVNTLKTTRKQLRELLRKVDVRATATPLSPVGLSISGHPRLTRLDAFNEGLFEIQDEGSQLIGLLAEAEPGQCIVDACAGAGGKALHLAAQMQNKGSLYALDLYEHRLKGLRPRTRRADVHNIRTHALETDTTRVDRLKDRADVVLVDAPCSGTGAVRRHPEALWGLTPKDLQDYADTQLELLARYARMVRPGGRLVYASCALLSVENQRVIEQFIAQNPEFAPLDAQAILARHCQRRPEPLDDSPWMRLHPHRHNTDGFFAAVLQRAPATEQEPPTDQEQLADQEPPTDQDEPREDPKQG